MYIRHVLKITFCESDLKSQERCSGHKTFVIFCDVKPVSLVAADLESLAYFFKHFILKFTINKLNDFL